MALVVRLRKNHPPRLYIMLSLLQLFLRVRKMLWRPLQATERSVGEGGEAEDTLVAGVGLPRGWLRTSS